MAQTIYIINAQGEQEPFSLQKLIRSIQRAGVSLSVSREIAQQIQKEIYAGITTGEIFQKVKDLIAHYKAAASWRFSLKQAMKNLGPTGFRFEKYVTAILQSLGYAVKLNQFISGKCLQHYEIDFIAEQKTDVAFALSKSNIKQKNFYFGECKYHYQSGMVVAQETALANWGRFWDLQQGAFALRKKREGFSLKPLLVTNARFSARAIKYAKCTQTLLWGWKHPVGEGLETIIDQYGLYPITILPSLNKDLAELFSQKNLLLAQDVLQLNIKKFALANHCSQEHLEALRQEAQMLLADKK